MAIMQRYSRFGLAVLALLAATAFPAAAQVGGVGNPGSNPFAQNPEADKTKVVRKPSGLPGARSGQVVTPAEKSAAEMRPTEALFDSVNRGDIAAARDAIGRGAELDGRNILGLTALELAVDLGRNDITFLLLSMRGAASGPDVEPRRAAPRPAAVARPVAPVFSRAAVVPVRQRSAGADPGTPAPQAGFLGFGGGSATR